MRSSYRTTLVHRSKLAILQCIRGRWEQTPKIQPILGFSLFQLESKWQPDTGNFLRTPTLARSNSRCRLNSVHHTRKESKRHQNSNIRLALTHISYFTAIEFAAPDHIPMIRLTASKLETEHPAVVTLHKKKQTELKYMVMIYSSWEEGDFFLATEALFPLSVRQLFFVLWPRTGSPSLCRMPL